MQALDALLAPIAPTGRFEFRVGDEIASLVDGEALAGSVEDPDKVVEGDPVAIHEMLVDGRFDRTTITGDRSLLERLVEAAPEPVALPSS